MYSHAVKATNIKQQERSSPRRQMESCLSQGRLLTVWKQMYLFKNPGCIAFLHAHRRNSMLPRKLFWFTLSLPCSAACGTGQTTIDTGCNPALLRNCVDHPADRNSFQKI